MKTFWTLMESVNYEGEENLAYWKKKPTVDQLKEFFNNRDCWYFGKGQMSIDSVKELVRAGEIRFHTHGYYLRECQFED